MADSHGCKRFLEMVPGTPLRTVNTCIFVYQVNSAELYVCQSTSVPGTILFGSE